MEQQQQNPKQHNTTKQKPNKTKQKRSPVWFLRINYRLYSVLGSNFFFLVSCSGTWKLDCGWRAHQKLLPLFVFWAVLAYWSRMATAAGTKQDRGSERGQGDNLRGPVPLPRSIKSTPETVPAGPTPAACERVSSVPRGMGTKHQNG